jgi:hypothetical protein
MLSDDDITIKARCYAQLVGTSGYSAVFPVPEDWTEEDIEEFLRGIKEDDDVSE